MRHAVRALAGAMMLPMMIPSARAHDCRARTAKAKRYEGPFQNGKLVGAEHDDCPATQGPLEC